MLRNRPWMNVVFGLWLCVVFCGCFFEAALAAELTPQPLPEDTVPLLEAAINETTLRPLIEQFTTPAYAGRRTQSIGGERAGTELARQLSDLGFEPLGTEGFFQPFSRKGLDRQFCTTAFAASQPSDDTAAPPRLEERSPTSATQQDVEPSKEANPEVNPEMNPPGETSPQESEQPSEARLCRNVVGVLRGSDPALRDEYLLLVAHYDHAGRQVWRYRDASGVESTCEVRTEKSKPTQGPPDQEHDYAFIDGEWRELLEPQAGEYKPGADDNASGCAGILAMGRFFASLPQRPSRSIILLFVDAEEVGLVGSTWFATHLPVPAERIVFVLNCDMLGRIRNRQVLCGGEQSAVGLRRLLCQYNRSEKTEQASLPFNRMEERDAGSDTFEFDFRGTMGPVSDHYAFSRLHIPHLILNSEMHGDYHGVGDTVDKIQFREMSELVRSVSRLVYTLAQQPDRLAFRKESSSETAQAASIIDDVWSPFEQDMGLLYGLDPADPGTLVVTDVTPSQWAASQGITKSDRIVSIADETTVWNGESFEQRWNALSHTPPQAIQVHESQSLDQLFDSNQEIETEPEVLDSTSCPNVYNETSEVLTNAENAVESLPLQRDAENAQASESHTYQVFVERRGRLFHVSLSSAL